MPKSGKIAQATIRRMTANQRDLLIAHIDGEVAVRLVDTLVMVRRTLIDAGLLRGVPPNTTRPRFTALTERGRAAVGMILGDYADALCRAGLLDQDNPLAALKRLKAMRNGAPAEPAPPPQNGALKIRDL